MPTTLTSLPDNGGVLSKGNLDAINAIVSVQNANNIGLALGQLTGADGLTAHAGGGQGSALALTAGINRIATVATIGNSVALPTSVAGLFVVVINDAALALQVFGADTDTINDVTTTVGIPVPGKSTAIFACPVAGKWYSAPSVPTSFTPSPATLAGDVAIGSHASGTYVITKGSAAALTLAAPTATTDDGKTLVITSNSAFLHAITATGLLQTGDTTVNVATFAAHPGASVTLMAYQAKWNVISQNQITFT